MMKGTIISSFVQHPVQILLQAKQPQKSKFLREYSIELQKSMSKTKVRLSQSSCFNTLLKRKTDWVISQFL